MTTVLEEEIKLMNNREDNKGKKMTIKTQIKLLLLNPLTGEELQSQFVVPTPMFQGHPVRMRHGFVSVNDLQLWKDNDRLQLQVDRMKADDEEYEANHDDLFRMMVSPAKRGDDTEFQIYMLADNIAENGVRRPPILDKDNALIDGNRRVSACYYIQMKGVPKYDMDAVKRAGYVYVWQLAEETMDDDRERVVISLNFEPDCKLDWPPYIRAKKIYEDYKDMMRFKRRTSGPEERAVRKALQEKYSLKSLTYVDRAIATIEWAEMFEEYHVCEKDRNVHDIRSSASELTNYFEELAKGSSPGTVAYELKRDEGLLNLVFDLLYDGKFDNFSQIRDLKGVYDDANARAALKKARDEDDLKLARTHFQDAMSIAGYNVAKKRQQGNAAERLKDFRNFLGGLSQDDMMSMTSLDLRDLRDLAELTTTRVKDELKRRDERLKEEIGSIPNTLFAIEEEAS